MIAAGYRGERGVETAGFIVDGARQNDTAQ